jgi:glutamate dehydrogenase/leucine dehydrogenase
MASGKTLVSFSEATKFEKEQILTTPCDILIPAAIGGVITGTPSKV